MNKLLVAPSPHITRHFSTNALMFSMFIALLPCAISGVITFGLDALWLILISTISGYAFDLLFRYLKDKKVSVLDISGAITGFVFALILPVSAPLWYPVVGTFIAIVIFKGLFGGIGKNILNPAGTARVILGIIFSGLSF